MIEAAGRLYEHNAPAARLYMTTTHFLMTRHLDTQLLHTGSPAFDPDTGVAPVNVPTVRTSTVRFASTDAFAQVMQRRRAGERIPSYGRQGMATHQALQDAIALLEGGSRCFLTPSGVSAISLAFLALVKPGDHVLVPDSVYGPVRKLDRSILRRLGIDVEYYPPGAAASDIRLRPNTRLLYIESPGSLLFEMQDLPALASLARAQGATVVADNTWGAGYLYRPLALGADISVVAATKYIAGHSDVMMGAVVAADAELAARLDDTHYALGLTVGADEASLALRGMRTLPVRLAQHQRNLEAVLPFLARHPGVARLWCPAWPEDPGHELWRRDCQGANGLLSISLNTTDVMAARRFVDALALFGIGYSWGGYESLVSLVEPADLAAHSAYAGSQPVVRLHIGLEHADDLIADLRQAFAAAGLE